MPKAAPSTARRRAPASAATARYRLATGGHALLDARVAGARSRQGLGRDTPAGRRRQRRRVSGSATGKFATRSFARCRAGHFPPGSMQPPVTFACASWSTTGSCRRRDAIACHCSGPDETQSRLAGLIAGALAGARQAEPVPAHRRAPPGRLSRTANSLSIHRVTRFAAVLGSGRRASSSASATCRACRPDDDLVVRAARLLADPRAGRTRLGSAAEWHRSRRGDRSREAAAPGRGPRRGQLRCRHHAGGLELNCGDSGSTRRAKSRRWA